jgi:K+-sensing histidine kinase KdpD
MPTHPTPVQHSLGVPSQRKKTDEVKLSILVDNIILYVKDQKNSTKKLPQHHKHLLQSSRIQNQLTKISSFLYINNEQIEKQYRKTILFTIASKKKKPNT